MTFELLFVLFYFVVVVVVVVVSGCSVNSAGFSRIKSVGLNWCPWYGHVPVHVRHMHGEPFCYIIRLAQNPAMHIAH